MIKTLFFGNYKKYRNSFYKEQRLSGGKEPCKTRGQQAGKGEKRITGK
jgi:hypothetical protein